MNKSIIDHIVDVSNLGYFIYFDNTYFVGKYTVIVMSSKEAKDILDASHIERIYGPMLKYVLELCEKCRYEGELVASVEPSSLKVLMKPYKRSEAVACYIQGGLGVDVRRWYNAAYAFKSNNLYFCDGSKAVLIFDHDNFYDGGYEIIMGMRLGYGAKLCINNNIVEEVVENA